MEWGKAEKAPKGKCMHAVRYGSGTEMHLSLVLLFEHDRPPQRPSNSLHAHHRKVR